MRMTRAALVVASVAVGTLAFPVGPALAGPAEQSATAAAESTPSADEAQPSTKARSAGRSRSAVEAQSSRKTRSGAVGSDEDGSGTAGSGDQDPVKSSDVDSPATDPVPAPAAGVVGSTPVAPPPDTAVAPGSAVPGAVSPSAPQSAPPSAALLATPAPPPGSPSTPEPHIITTFADQLQGGRTPVPRRGLQPVPVRSDVDGCNRDYGTAAQCIPKALPGGQGDICSYLAKRGITGVKVRGADRKGIDRNRNGVVCD
jgi:hypothetical protein